MTPPTPHPPPAGPDQPPALHLDLDYFRHRYAASPDPWGFDTAWYEQRKYALTVAALPERRHRRGLEAGCANGALTAALAGRCEHLVAFDVVPEALGRARRRLQGHANVEVVEGRYPTFWPEPGGDLVVWSEVAYYLTPAGAEVALDGLLRWLEPGGTLVAVHYTGDTDHPRHGRDIGPWLDAVADLARTTTLHDERFELGVWQRRAGS